MMYRCLECGHTFEDGEQGTCVEHYGEFWGEPCSESFSCCPMCNGDYVELEECKRCGEFFESCDLTDGMCKNCVEELGNDVETCYEVAETEKQSVKINCFLAEMFTPEDINEILLDVLLSKEKCGCKVDCQKFIDSDPVWFAERLNEVLDNEKKK